MSEGAFGVSASVRDYGLPSDLGQWSFSTVVDLVKRHEYEPGSFDYKAVLSATKSEGTAPLLDAIRRTVCSMANSDGGFILFGVQDRQVSVEAPEGRIVGIPTGGDLRKEFGDKIADVQPDVFFDASPRPIPVPTRPGHGVFVVHIPPSMRRPHMVEPKGVFYRREGGGSARPMTVSEVRDQMVFSQERLRKLELLRLHVTRFERMARRMQAGLDLHSPDRFETATFNALIADAISLLPQSAHYLQRLLDLSLAATRVNNLLDRVLSGGGPANAWAGERVRSSLRDIEQGCQDCRGELDMVLGPLPPGISS